MQHQLQARHPSWSVIVVCLLPPLSALLRTYVALVNQSGNFVPIAGSVMENIAASVLPSSERVNILAPINPGKPWMYRSLASPLANKTKTAFPLLASSRGQPFSPIASGGFHCRPLHRRGDGLVQWPEIRYFLLMSPRSPKFQSGCHIGSCSGQSLGSTQMNKG